MVYITGDTHGNDRDVKYRCEKYGIKPGDTLIIVGDVGANFYMSPRDRGFKGRVNKLGITVFCVHGNHEARPETFATYKTKEWNGGIVYYEEEYPNLIFAKDGEIYDIDGKSVMVCGGAYSVDKYYRAFRASMYAPYKFTSEIIYLIEKLASNGNLSADAKKKVDEYIDGLPSDILYWWKDEQPSDAIKNRCEEALNARGWKIDVILTHTSPERFEPVEVFLPGLNQDNVDKTTEKWFNEIEEKTDYKKWYAGHYHTNKKVNDKFQFLYEEVQIFCQDC